jgi:hypothetical protein
MLEPILRIIDFIWTLVKSKNREDYILEYTNSIDQTNNAFGKELFTDLWVKDGAYKFGNADETMSSYISDKKGTGCFILNFMNYSFCKPSQL